MKTLRILKSWLMDSKETMAGSQYRSSVSSEAAVKYGVLEDEEFAEFLFGDGHEVVEDKADHEAEGHDNERED
eukprot:CAMPEP_0170497390 /NCGR_PEP_ID=MMETSP0208-20121228/24657_1 /TAXON_ID=197538 /ORGANISM="Strombidium inclinatum, Strain S3" /LENGTH=72 /DNA_ID=CAMNT_0010774191 /DNA_START=29 /DNA_END=246 /DNA_ORIENTATION=+